VQNAHTYFILRTGMKMVFFSMVIMVVLEISESFNNLPFLVLQTLEITDVGF